MPLVDSTDPAAKNGKVRSHRFPGANTALPFVNKDAVQLKAVQDFLRDGQISVDVFGITRPRRAPRGEPSGAPGGPQLSSTFAVGEESGQFGVAASVSSSPPVPCLGPLDKVPVSVRRGESVRVEVVVRTRKVGHFFPGGTVDAFDVWVELEAVDENGRVLLHSGAVEDDGKGPVENGAHFYRSLQLDEHGNPINKRNAWMTRSVAYVRLIPPGAADTVHYRLQIPKDAGEHHHSARQGQLPQVRLVEHAVVVCRRARAGTGGQSAGHPFVRRWPVAVQRRHVERVGAGQGDSRHPDDRDGAGECDAARHRRRRAAAGDRARSWTRRCASAGTTTASGCCCRAT